MQIKWDDANLLILDNEQVTYSSITGEVIAVNRWQKMHNPAEGVISRSVQSKQGFTRTNTHVIWTKTSTHTLAWLSTQAATNARTSDKRKLQSKAGSGISSLIKFSGSEPLGVRKSSAPHLFTCVYEQTWSPACLPVCVFARTDE